MMILERVWELPVLGRPRQKLAVCRSSGKRTFLKLAQDWACCENPPFPQLLSSPVRGASCRALGDDPGERLPITSPRQGSLRRSRPFSWRRTASRSSVTCAFLRSPIPLECKNYSTRITAGQIGEFKLTTSAHYSPSRC